MHGEAASLVPERTVAKQTSGRPGCSAGDLLNHALSCQSDPFDPAVCGPPAADEIASILPAGLDKHSADRIALELRISSKLVQTRWRPGRREG